MNELVNVGSRDGASYRDPSGHVYLADGRVFRTVMERARDDYEYARDSGLLHELQERSMLVGTTEISTDRFEHLGPGVAYVLEHEPVPWVSYPYEWTFSALKSAAILHLDVQIRALARGVTLSDASAYNIQFVGARPVFIDVLSFRKYRDGEFWIGHRQFCEQFLNPLLLGALLGVRHNSWYRGSLEGIDTLDLSRLLGWRDKLSWNVLSNVSLQARMQQKSLGTSTSELSRLRSRRLPRTQYLAILHSLRRWISGLMLRNTGETVWQKYSSENTYSNEEAETKHNAIRRFAERIRPQLAWDLGCNTGEYSETLLKGGADFVVGLDFDLSALEGAYQRSRDRKLSLLPLCQDAANPSPGQGWKSKERKPMVERRPVDAVVALAFEHHLAIGRNIPLSEVVRWLISLAPQGIIEFVHKSDPTVQKMLALREDIFPDYREETFRAALQERAQVVERVQVSKTGRALYWYIRRDQDFGSTGVRD